MTDDLVTIAGEGLSARINPLGAELWSLTDAAGAQYMTDADPAFWSGHAPFLFPIVGALSGDTLRLDGREFSMPKHGFARRSRFAPVHAEGAEARFRLTDSPETRSVYPFGLVLEVAYRIEAMTLHTEVSVFNPNAEALPFSFGFHPAFAWPLPGGFPKQDHKLVFEKVESPTLRQLTPNSGELSPDSRPSPANSRELMLSEDLFRNDALIWDVFESKSLTYGVDGGTTLDLHFPDTTSMGVWQVPGARYICIEPWQGHADPAGFTGDFREKPGVVLLDPGATRTFRMDVTVRPA
ncbi:aldose 1-epimerase family protein [Novosphingobium sp. ERW19]|uniref:aldose 1-epimerase family protein n=1 Tax=Novosphingobium sp. ERW19 TaxID=2726186 RepID=UPI0014568D2E|nr:aldose 1-epimerase family protein [Novosphingobium sp. ERW19]NLR41021.1 aldose 1-epimerase family protein [Novosphingobium sp. ERW19]